MSTETQIDETRRLPTCRCGYTREDRRVRGTPHYGFWSWVLLLNGATAYPKKITYRCTRCHQVVEETRDPKVLRTLR